ncbi:methyltransferase domain-containing protein [Actinomadura sp. WAC 06369]|uniref:methyltransferase domain-containing protein n=1 Tax=Actinomadura sp. WAC 06369 TaxID=2203193 RepID=UPI000F7B2E34|nr:methyltransferase domain-containing protein [Actinomadura sp. WAC 06369]RSN51649.1 class I SAM-dependent methyltransferase [Actinomadura sp. WAC 06369]
MDDSVPPDLADHPDRLRWNAKYAPDGSAGADAGAPVPPAHPLAADALRAAPDGPVLDLACGPSGAALSAAAAGRPVTAVDISDVALARLGAAARRRGLAARITLVQADLGTWRPPAAAFAAVLCTGFWDRAAFAAAVPAVAPGGVLAWEAFTAAARRDRPHLPAAWCLAPGEPASLLPDGFRVLDQRDVQGGKRRILARS